MTNDDGITSPSLLVLAQEMRKVGEVTVLAPDRNWSASGHVKTMHRPLRVWEAQMADGTFGLTTDGAPSDCVALAMLGLLPDKVDLVVSGINPNANLGHDVTYSGTVTSAMEASIWGLPGIAISLDSPEIDPNSIDFGPAARIAHKVVQEVLANDLPEGIFLNVNVPNLSDNEIRGICITRQGLRLYRDQLIERHDPRGQPYYWIGGEKPTGLPEDGNDFGALREGYVSITPLHLDLTAYSIINEMKKWSWGRRY
ncbi:MAG: 5'/3'-nucleotidase SurE [Anaerolineales bacterium]